MRRIDGVFHRRRLFLGSTARRSWWQLFGVIFVLSATVVGGVLISRPAGAAYDLIQLVQDGRYLVLFQNNTELRPTGGFLGSFAVVNIKNKQLQNYWFETNIYKADNAFAKRLVIPQPKPIDDTWPGRSWALNSANWSVDFSTAAGQIKWFYEQEYQDKIDGVVAVNASVMIDLLRLLGPVNLTGHQMLVTADNFLSTVQYKIEREYFESAENLADNEPKTILKDLLSALIKRIDLTEPVKIWQLVDRRLADKSIQVSFSNQPAAQSIAEKRNWAGRVADTPISDQYLLINNANLNGGKGSLGVKQSIIYEFKADQDNPTVKLTIRRFNQGRVDWPVGENRNYTRVLVPLGSQLLYASLDREPIADIAREIEANKSSFGFWFSTPLHQAKTAVLTYRLPASNQACYWLLPCQDRLKPGVIIQKQSGAPPDELDLYQDGRRRFTGWIEHDMTIK